MTNQEVKIIVAADKIAFTIENTFIQSFQSHSDVYDLSKLYLEIRVSKIFQKVLNIRSAMVKSPIEIFDKEDFITLGDMLSKLLLDQKILHQNFSNTFKFINDSPDVRCRIFLEFDKNVREMAELPWEYMRFEKHYLAAHARSCFDLIRKINLGDEYDQRSFDIPEKMNIILVIADPGTPDRALPNSEKESLIDMMKGLKRNHPDTFNYGVVTAPTRKNLIEKIREARAGMGLTNEPFIIHFYGHAKPDAVALAPGKDNATAADWVSDAHFADLFDEMVPAEKPSVFVFTACDSGKITQFAENRGVALLMLAQHKLPAVLAMQNEVISNVAIAFMQEVYQSMLKGADLSEAVSKGRTYLGAKHEYHEQQDKGSYSNNAFGSPVLFSSTFKSLAFIAPAESGTQGWVEKFCTSRQSASCAKIEKYPESVVRCKYCGAMLQSLSGFANPAASPSVADRSAGQAVSTQK